MAGDEENGDGDEDDAQVGLAPLPRRHLGVGVRVLAHALKVMGGTTILLSDKARPQAHSGVNVLLQRSAKFFFLGCMTCPQRPEASHAT